MKSFSKYLYHFFIVAILVGCNQNKSQDITSINIDEIISKMSVKEKVGQMTQLNLDVISAAPFGLFTTILLTPDSKADSSNFS